ncbi:HTH domain-containing protein, partial [Prevotella sp.]
MQKYGRELDLLLLLSDNGSYTAQQIADRLGITRRHLYNYFEYLRDCGF